MNSFDCSTHFTVRFLNLIVVFKSQRNCVLLTVQFNETQLHMSKIIHVNDFKK